MGRSQLRLSDVRTANLLEDPRPANRTTLEWSKRLRNCYPQCLEVVPGRDLHKASGHHLCGLSATSNQRQRPTDAGRGIGFAPFSGRGVDRSSSSRVFEHVVAARDDMQVAQRIENAKRQFIELDVASHVCHERVGEFFTDFAGELLLLFSPIGTSWRLIHVPPSPTCASGSPSTAPSTGLLAVDAILASQAILNHIRQSFAETFAGTRSLTGMESSPRGPFLPVPCAPSLQPSYPLHGPLRRAAPPVRHATTGSSPILTMCQETTL